MSPITMSRSVTNTFAIILAGGRGERLKHLTERQAKPALPFGAKYRVIDFPLSNCINSGIRKISVATQYCAHDLIDHVHRGWSFLNRNLGEFVEVWPAQRESGDGGWYAGTADAVYRNIELLRRHRPQYVLILAGDHVYKQDYGAMIAEHMARGAEVTVACVEVPREDAKRFGVIEAGPADEILHFHEKPSTPPVWRDKPGHVLASMGIYVFNTDILLAALRADAKQPESSRDFGRDILPALVGRSHVFMHRFSQSCVGEDTTEPYWRDVGTLDAYWEANMDMLRPQPAMDLYDRAWPLWTAHTTRPPVRLMLDSGDRASNISNAVISEGCVVAGATIRNAQIFHDVRLEAFSMVEDTVILPDCEVGARARIRRAILASGCRIPEDLVVGEDAVADAKYFYCTANGVVVITPRMLARMAASERAAQVSTVRPAVRMAVGADIQLGA